MEQKTNDLFFSRLPVNEIPLGDLLMEDHLFFKIPANWHVVVTDIKNSTAAVSNGLHETINLVATGCIVAVLNLAYKANITVPFFFGGDGASFIIPNSMLDIVMRVLHIHQQNTKKSFNLDLRIGHVAVQEIYEQGHALNISKFRTSGVFTIPVLLGNGFNYAEKKIKGPDYRLAALSHSNEELDLSGMQCRWDRIKPPENSFEVISLLVIARDAAQQSAIFKKVIDSIDEIYGDTQNRNPITVGKLKLKATLAKIGLEMNARMGGFRPFYLVSNWVKASLGYFYFKTKKGKVYLYNLVDMSDTLIIDGRINTVISGTASQREQLETALNKMEADGEIFYGLYVSKESVMSCYVGNLRDRHIHFVDGAEGGYTKAAGVIKQKNILQQSVL
jgi:hypothetical protein